MTLFLPRYIPVQRNETENGETENAAEEKRSAIMNEEKKRDAVGYKHCCVVDAQGRYITLVLVLLEENEEGQVEERVQYYTLQEGERLVEAGPPTARPYAGAAGLVSPVWDDGAGAWTEGASEEEIAAWEAEHPAPELPEPEPSAEELMDILLGV